MRVLIVFFSLEGNTRLIADAIREETGGDLTELVPVRSVPSSGFGKFLKGGLQVLSKKIPELEPFDAQPSDCDAVFLGTPVWAGTFAPALRGFIARFAPLPVPAAYFCCHRGGKGRVFQKLSAAVSAAGVLGEADFYEPLKKDRARAVERARAWAREICSKTG